ncbi:hypothetical protein HYH02_012906 [Chlamydomonas schloesseri]|uniref:Heterokaryon incompatibility domain-containing protein n=1 Tax=Chlamydomonas schloesseri TaxID=2026947 RepID=A0A835ST74_9CHLO|nr:hypothetical protein HYH02_012906 [Chlamydomonas schloesseri]|eukprot:KAG2432774.1 hypothetical protein HYH02_012906 [Chlamydomonas schloesseri]
MGSGPSVEAPGRNQVVPYDSHALKEDTARLRKQLEEVMANFAKTLEATAISERKRADAEAAAQRARLDDASAAERKKLDDSAALARGKLDEAAAAERRRAMAQEEEAAAAERKRLDAEAEAVRMKLDQQSAEHRKDLDRLAAVMRKELDDAAAAQRQRLDEEAAKERAQLHSAVQATLAQLEALVAGAASGAPAAGVQPPQAGGVAAAAAANAAASAEAAALAAERRKLQQEMQQLEQQRQAVAAAQAAAAAAAAAAPAAAAARPAPAAGAAPAPAPAPAALPSSDAIEGTWKPEDLLCRILPHGVPLDELPESLRDLHDGMPAALREAPMRLLHLDRVLGWSNIKVYEEVDTASECIEVPYGSVSDEVWDGTLILSWRWAALKPTAHVPGFSPMSELQFGELAHVLQRAKAAGMSYVWIDWCCVPQYVGSPMVEVLRSKVFYARARSMTVIPTFFPIPADGIVRLLLVKASRVIKRRAAASPRAAVVASRLDDILKKEVVAGREYFSRVWTLAERMARLGRREQLCHWLSLEAWLGMLVDALLKSTDDRSASAIFKMILGEQAAELLEVVLDPLSEAVKTGSMHVSEGLDERVADLFESAVAIWHASKGLEEAPTREWLQTYLSQAHSGMYQAWSDADRVWSVYSYFCWKQLDQSKETALLEALQDLVRVAGGSRKHLMGMATRLGLAKQLPASDVDNKLVAAARTNDTAAVLAALAEGGFPDTRPADGMTALHHAATHGNAEAVKALLAEGASQGIKDASGSTAVFAAAAAGHGEVLKLLLAVPAGKKDLETTGKDQNTPLAVAAENGHAEALRVLLAAGAARDAANEKKETPASLACKMGHAEVIKILLDAGLDPNFKREGYTLLYLATFHGRLECVKMLLSAGADKDMRNDNGYCPIAAAAELNKAEVLKYLISVGANMHPTFDFKSNNTLLHRAAFGNAPESAQVLIDAGFNKEAFDSEDQKTALSTAASRNNVAVMKTLIANKVNMDDKDNDDFTALHWAAQKGHYAACELLIAAGANVSAKTRKHNTPRDVADDRGIKALFPKPAGIFF